MDSSLPEDQKVLLLDQLLQRYQGLTKQMKTEATVKPTVVMPKSEPLPAKESTPKPETKSTKVSKPLRDTPLTAKGSKIPLRTETPLSVSTEETAHALMMDTPPPDSRRKTGKRRYKEEHPWWRGYEAIDNGNRTNLSCLKEAALDKYRTDVYWLWHDLLDVLDALAPYEQDWIDNTQPHEEWKHIEKLLLQPDKFCKTCWYWLDLMINGIDEVDR